MKLFKYLISAILLLGIFSCEEYNYSDGVLDILPRKLTLDKTSVEFVEGEKSLTREVVVTSENISWAITGVPDWLEVSPLEGGSGTTAVKLTASKLPVGDKRNAVIKLESLVPKFKYSHEIKVSQGVDLEFGISATLLSFENTAGEKNVAVTTNALWEAECDASWVTIEKSGDTSLTVNVEENEAFEDRTATISLKKEGTEDVLGSVSVKQSKATFELQPVSLEFGNTSSNKTVAVTTNISWEAECDASWVTIEKNGDTSLTVNVEENEAFEERAAIITFKREGTDEVLGTVEIKQAAAVPNINGHEYVDLGLPSGLKWAACNVGASKPEEYGDYFAWGETSPKSSYSSSNSVTYGKSMSDIGGDAQYDAARANRGGDWRLPTKAEFAELLNSSNCTWTWTTQNGVNGYKVTSVRNGSSIFLPAAGYRDGTSLNNGGSGGYYWSSTPFESNDGYSYDLFFYSGRHSTDWHSRNDGRSVRPVSE